MLEECGNGSATFVLEEPLAEVVGQPIALAQIVAQRVAEVVVGSDAGQQRHDALQAAIDQRTPVGQDVDAGTLVLHLLGVAAEQGHVHVGQRHRRNHSLQLLPTARLLVRFLFHLAGGIESIFPPVRPSKTQ